jgi:agmatinase
VPQVGLKDLYLVKRPTAFGGYEWSRDKTIFSFVGAPFDSTSTFKPGSRFAPDYLRVYSRSLELFSPRSGVDMEEIGVYDEGDVAVFHGDSLKTIEAIETVVKDLISEGRIPIVVGGEHTVTLGPVRALPRDIGVVVLDAHMDLRDEYMGNKFSHACVSKRIADLLGPGSVLLVGVRAYTKEELRVAAKSGVDYVTSLEFRREGRRAVAGKILRFMDNHKHIYLSIDIDVLDPSFAPGTGTPEPDGIATWDLLDLLYDVVDERVSGFDVVEINPLADPSGVTSMLGAKIVFEVASYIYSKRFRDKKSRR